MTLSSHPTAPRRWTLIRPNRYPLYDCVEVPSDKLRIGESVEVMPVSEHEAEVARLRGIIDELTPERRCECGHRQDVHAAGRCGGVVRSSSHPQGVPFYRSCPCAGFRECS